jgi:hypothetical protein
VSNSAVVSDSSEISKSSQLPLIISFSDIIGTPVPLIDDTVVVLNSSNVSNVLNSAGASESNVSKILIASETLVISNFVQILSTTDVSKSNCPVVANTHITQVNSIFAIVDMLPVSVISQASQVFVSSICVHSSEVSNATQLGIVSVSINGIVPYLFVISVPINSLQISESSEPIQATVSDISKSSQVPNSIDTSSVIKVPNSSKCLVISSSSDGSKPDTSVISIPVDT